MDVIDASTGEHIATDLKGLWTIKELVYRCPKCGWTAQSRVGNSLTAFDYHNNVVESTGRVCVPCLIRWLRDKGALTIMNECLT